MRYVSTRDATASVSLAEAVFAGTAPDGGLWVPERLSPLDDASLVALRDASSEGDAASSVAALRCVSRVLARHLFGGDLDEATIDSVVDTSLDFPVPVREIEPGVSVVELFHGPTLAFKDVGARFMARLMAALLDAGHVPPSLASSQGNTGSSTHQPRLTVLVATSGDTGAAVAHAFWNLPPFEVVVLFPRGQVSDAQRRLFSTLGGNVRVAAVEGTFDDCQRMVKEAFADPELARISALVSANSINIARLLPQSFYYAHAALALGAFSSCSPLPPAGEGPGVRAAFKGALILSVPSGNFGNLTAGLVARRLGVPIQRFVAATNVNDVVPRYVASGLFEPRPSLRTLSNAMDVGNPSNLERMRWLHPDLNELRGLLEAHAFTDAQTLAAMREVHDRTGTLLDPHAAVGYLGLRRALASASGAFRGAFLATAHPAKFAEVADRIGVTVDLPPALRDCFDRPEHIDPLPPTLEALRDWL
ncbi:MAG TPA: threonine synthase [Thermoanaerobaculia bacterium]|nr:threonine synthase [Thermoanaerobaculia bacterium]